LRPEATRKKIQGLKGFRDFFPEAFALRQHVFSAWRRVGGRYGFAEYDGPPLEPLDLYTTKSGDEIVGQLYHFIDKGGREVALRPEMTPTFARMIAARASALPKPIRWFSIPQLFRYERPQRGRLREHFQLNMDIVGETDPLADAEIIAAAIDTLRELGLDHTHVVARISDRRLITAILDANEVSSTEHAAVFGALDKLEKEGRDSVGALLEKAGVGPEAMSRLLSMGSASLEDLRETYAGVEAVTAATDRLSTILGYLDAGGFAEYTRFDGSLVRGLAYYTGMVFELWERKGELRAICGGGRYDDLLQALGGVDLPALGFGMGDVVLCELLKDLDLVPDEVGRVDDYVICVTEAERAAALDLARALRESGRRVSYDLRVRPVGKQFKAANQSGAERAIVLGPDELARGVVSVRDMASGEARELALESVKGGAS